jgi:hypothetical protein
MSKIIHCNRYYFLSIKQTKISSYCPFPFPPYSNLITNECLHDVNGKSGDASHKIKWDMRCFINNRMIFRWGFQEIKREKGWVFTFKVVYLSFIYVFNIFLAKGKKSTSNHRHYTFKIYLTLKKMYKSFF